MNTIDLKKENKIKPANFTDNIRARLKSAGGAFKDEYARMVDGENIREQIWIIVLIIVFTIVHILFFRNATNWSSPLMVGILHVVALIVLFPSVNAIFRRIINVFKGYYPRQQNNTKRSNTRNRTRKSSTKTKQGQI